MPAVEKRKFPRVRHKDAIKHTLFSMPGAMFSEAPESMSVDIGAGGILFEAKNGYAVGDVIRMEMKIPGWEKYKPEFIKPGQLSKSNPLVVLAKVVRSKVVSAGKYDIAVQFVGIDDGHQMALARLIRELIRQERDRH